MAKDFKQRFLTAVEQQSVKRWVEHESAALGMKVGFRKLRLRDQTAFGLKVSSDKDVAENIAAEYLALTLCDPETGELTFPGGTGVLELQVMLAEALMPLWREAQKANGLGQLEDHRKNSAPIPGGSSSSASPATSGEPSPN